jgi:hypothetical protein
VASFAEEIRAATQALSGFTAALRLGGLGAGAGAGGAVGAMAGIAGARGALAGAGPAGLALAGATLGFEAAAAGARFLTPAASQFAITGSSQGFASAVTASVLGAAQNTAIGGLVLGATGVAAPIETNQRAGQSVLSVTEDLARIGVNVSPRQRQRLFDVAQEQEARATEERARVAEIANSATALAKAKPAGAGEGFDAIVSALQSIENVVRNVVGGRN